MAYPHTHYEVDVLASGGEKLLTVSGLERRWAPGYVPHVLRAVSLMLTTGSTATNAPRISIRRGIFGAATASGDEQTAITLTSGMSAGAVKYVDNLNVTIIPGQELTVIPSLGATTVLTAACKAYVEPKWETPANNTSMSETV